MRTGICTAEGRTFHMHKAMGLVRDGNQDQKHARICSATVVIGQVRFILLQRQCRF